MLEDARKNLVGLPSTVYKDALVMVTQYLDGLLDQCKAA
jgi:octaprenyl-diphosphate synthase